ncbi:hypothetical protein MASR2M79_21270 [Aminivibrio sp.]
MVLKAGDKGAGRIVRPRDEKGNIARHATTHMGFVDDRLMPGELKPPVAAPVEMGLMDDSFRQKGSAVLFVHDIIPL